MVFYRSIYLLLKICLDYNYFIPRLVGRSELQAYFKDLLITGILITREDCRKVVSSNHSIVKN
jgi:hypothetical protein